MAGVRVQHLQEQRVSDVVFYNIDLLNNSSVNWYRIGSEHNTEQRYTVLSKTHVKFRRFLVDHTNLRAYATMLRPSVCRL